MESETELAWGAVLTEAARLRGVHLRELFARDPSRAERFSLEACDLFVDYSKNRFDATALKRLLGLAEAIHLEEKIASMFAGEAVNATEGRAALHVALRRREPGPFPVSPDGTGDVMTEVREVLARLRAFSEAVRSGRWRGQRGSPITDVVNIGIGGSDLGPRLACDALAEHARDPLRTHFVSNLDSTELDRTLEGLDPAATLFLVASKTFGTHETLTNARSARRWLVAAEGEQAVGRHFAALSSERRRVAEFGIEEAQTFEFWDWVGGRYSLWSAIGCAIALGLGFEVFERLHAGAARMDEHFLTAPFDRNLPVLLGLLRIWYRNGFGAETRALLPYDFALRHLPAYLQQLEMESLGKRVMSTGHPVARATCPVVWGGLGNNGQHAFYQLLHQGTQMVPSDFIIPARLQRSAPGHERAVLANALAQMEALMRGRTFEEAQAELDGAGGGDPGLAAHMTMEGNQPTTAILYERLDPERLGALIALYEHEVFVQGALWGVNPFDQFGVELGKRLAELIEVELSGSVGGRSSHQHDPSTFSLIERLRRMPAG